METQEYRCPLSCPDPVGYSPDQIANSFFDWVLGARHDDGSKREVAIRRQPYLRPNPYIVASSWDRFPVVDVVAFCDTVDEAKRVGKDFIRGKRK
jgi:hypothetical protein